MTRIIIEPYMEQKIPTYNEPQLIKYNWSEIFQVDFANELQTFCDGILHRCTNLTKCEIKGDFPSPVQKYLVSISPVKSPIQSIYNKESGTVAMRKFLSTIESSYSSNYCSLYDSNRLIYAILDAINFRPDVSFSTLKKQNVIKMSNFLQKKLALFELNPKVLINAKAIDQEESKILFDCNKIKNITLKTNYSKEVIFFIFS